MDEWLLYAMESPSACKARGLAIGRIFTRDGQLVATVAQEGLIRYRGATAP
jgi:acyl-CoA thioesterase-2